jgi:aminoglycoside phosphotransferase family enzyme
MRRRRDGTLTLSGRGRIVEWLVVMRRLPAARMLDVALRARTVDAEDVRRIASTLARFFTSATARGLSAARYRRRLEDRISVNARELLARELALDRHRIEPVIDIQRRYVERAGAILAGRAARLRDGHGDLRPEHVNLGPPLCVIDCLEFAADFRRLDPAEEIAFLALECARLGAGELASAIVQQYGRLSHDRVPESLLCFYMSQRAVTRAKITAWHLRDPQYTSRRRWVVRANSYLDDALRYARLALGQGDGPLFLATAPAVDGEEREENGVGPLVPRRRKKHEKLDRAPIRQRGIGHARSSGASGSPPVMRRSASPSSGATRSTRSFEPAVEDCG